MKNTTSLKYLLGLSQEEMAIVLCINTSQWAMYKSGQRNLPLAAKKRLASILLHLQSTKDTSNEKQKFIALEQRKAQEWFEQEQRTIAYKKQFLQKRKNTLENKRMECFAALEVVRFLETQSAETPASLLEEIKIRTTNTLNKYSLHKLEELQMKEVHLDLLQKYLEQKIDKNTKGL